MKNETVEYLKEVAWVVLMVNLFLAVGAALISPALGLTVALWLFAGLATMVALLFFGTVVLNLACAFLHTCWERARRSS